MLRILLPMQYTIHMVISFYSCIPNSHGLISLARGAGRYKLDLLGEYSVGSLCEVAFLVSIDSLKMELCMAQQQHLPCLLKSRIWPDGFIQVSITNTMRLDCGLDEGEAGASRDFNFHPGPGLPRPILGNSCLYLLVLLLGLHPFSSSLFLRITNSHS